MLEIIALIYMAKNIGNIVEDKGYKPGWWKFYMVMAWIGSEVIFMVLGMLLLGFDNIFVYIIAIAAAITSYFVVKQRANALPDLNEGNDIDEIGQHNF